MTDLQVGIMVAVAALATILTRYLAFWVFAGREVPPFVHYLGKVLPASVMAMLVIFCLRDTPIATTPHGIPELVGVAATLALWYWRKSVLLATVGATAIYVLVLHLFV